MTGERRRVEYYLSKQPQLDSGVSGLLDLIYAEYCLREENGEKNLLDDYAVRFPAYLDRLRPLFALHRAVAEMPTGGSKRRRTISCRQS